MMLFCEFFNYIVKDAIIIYIISYYLLNLCRKTIKASPIKIKIHILWLPSGLQRCGEIFVDVVICFYHKNINSSQQSDYKFYVGVYFIQVETVFAELVKF